MSIRTLFLTALAFSTVAPAFAADCDSYSTVLGQVGVVEPSASVSDSSDEFLQTGGWVDEFDYDRSADSNPASLPDMPGYLSDEYDTETGCRRNRGSCAGKINIDFTLENRRTDTVLCYYRAGSEVDDILVDGVYLDSCSGTEFKTGVCELEVGTLSAGAHTITLEYVGGGDENGHNIDALRLVR